VTFLSFFEPNVFSPVGTLIFVLVALCYWRGQRRLKTQGTPVVWWKAWTFYLCWGLAYVVLETKFDYFAQFIFFMHRLQHLLLHHLLTFFLALATPFPVLNAGLGERFPRHWLPFRLLRGLILRLMQPAVAPLLFIGLIVLWLIPPIHIAAMLNYPLYITMNWSMLVDGLLFWPMILDRRIALLANAAPYWKRLLGLFFTIAAQMAIGAYITFDHSIIYRIYSVCGRPWPISPVTDQALGGVLTWVPPAMMSVIAAFILIIRYLREEEARAKRYREAHGPESVTNADTENRADTEKDGR
jgi:putative membrane protein